MFAKILIANRGEIALRVMRACRELGIATVAVYSKGDEASLHAQLADESVCIGPPGARESYLNMHAVLSATVATGCTAIHPGYGFLSENATFAAMCKRCNIAFIGPDPAAMERMGHKMNARRAMMAAGVPVTPGSEDILASPAEAAKIAGRVG
jgi:acetyl-CoA carboxylase biotin carboxylase subunit